MNERGLLKLKKISSATCNRNAIQRLLTKKKQKLGEVAQILRFKKSSQLHLSCSFLSDWGLHRPKMIYLQGSSTRNPATKHWFAVWFPRHSHNCSGLWSMDTHVRMRSMHPVFTLIFYWWKQKRSKMQFFVLKSLHHWVDLIRGP